MRPRDLQRRLHGVLAFTPTPFTMDDRVDLEGLARHVDFLVRNGAHAVVACGGVGEFFALELDEYRGVIRTAVEATSGRVPVLVGIGHTTRIACRLAEHAASVGADGLLIHPQYFIDPSDEGIVRHYRMLGRAAGLGMMIYSTGSAVAAPALVRRLAEIDEVVALKDEHGDLGMFTEMVRQVGPRLAWINGMAEMRAAPYAAAGAQAFTSGIVNFAPRLTLAVWSAVAGGRREDLDDLLARKIRPIASLRERRRGYAIAVVKEAMNFLGLPGGTVRLPLTPLAPEDRQELRRVLIELELMDCGWEERA